MFRKLSKMETRKQVLFSILIAFAVIFFWRGVWGLMDLYLFPDDRFLSTWVSVAIGSIILMIANYIALE